MACLTDDVVPVSVRLPLPYRLTEVKGFTVNSSQAIQI
jgi:hypothetical protein